MSASDQSGALFFEARTQETAARMTSSHNLNPIFKNLGLDERSAEIFQRVERMEEPTRSVFAHLIFGLAEKIRKEQRLKGELLGPGTEHLLEFIKYQKRNIAKWDPLLGRAFTSFFNLNDQGRAVLCHKIYEPICLVDLYREVCRKLETPESAEDVKAIIETSLRQGGDEGHALLENLIGSDLLKAFEPNSPPSEH